MTTSSHPLSRITEELEQLVQYEQALGRKGYAVAPETLARLKRPAAGRAVAQQATSVSTRPEPAPTESLSLVADQVRSCTLCPLHRTRQCTVPGQGHAHPEIAFIGEGPGAEEDLSGEAFVGAAGQLLTKMILAMGFSRDQVWIGNIVKCRPPENRKPLPEEMEACMPWLRRQLALLQPRIIVCLGATATQGLLQTTTNISKLRGTWMSFESYDVMPTFHPAYLLRDPSKKRDVWSDLKAVLERLGRPVPER